MSDSIDELFDDVPVREIPDQDVDSFDAPDMSPQDIAKNTADMVARVLEATNLIEVKELHSSVGQIHFLCRVKDDDKKRWSKLKKNCLVAMQKAGDGFIGTQDIVKLKNGAPDGSENPDDYDHKFGHVFSLGAKDIRAAAISVCETIVDFEPEIRQRREVMEAPLSGRGSPQSGGQRGGRKGAHPTSTNSR